MLSGLGRVSNELQDVQRIMVQNIEDVIQRGEALTMLDDKAHNLSLLSNKYKVRKATGLASRGLSSELLKY